MIYIVVYGMPVYVAHAYRLRSWVGRQGFALLRPKVPTDHRTDHDLDHRFLLDDLDLSRQTDLIPIFV